MTLHEFSRKPRNQWRSLKRARSISLTDEGWELLSQRAQAEQCSASEIIERLVRGQVPASTDTTAA